MPPTPEELIDDAHREEIKMTSTGAIKDPKTGSSAKASDSSPTTNETPAQKAMRETKAKLSGATAKDQKATAENPNPDAAKAPTSPENKTGETTNPPVSDRIAATSPLSDPERLEESQQLNEEQSEKPLEEGISDLNGKLSEGSFAIEFKKSGVLIRIPVSMETARDSYTLDNTFKLIKDIQGVKTKKELEEKYASFLPEGV